MSTFSIFGKPGPRVETRPAVERYFEAALYLLIVTGFATLALTGKLDLLSLVVVSLALLVRGQLLVRGRTIILPQKVTDQLTIAYVGFYFADLFLLSRSFVTATVRLLLFAMVVKIFAAQRGRDESQASIPAGEAFKLAALAFAMVLAAAILTVDSVFLAAFCVFMLLAVATFTSLEMKLAAESATGRAREPQDGTRRMAWSLSATALALMVAIALGAVGMFFILPRVQTRYLSAFAYRNQLVSGFSDDVRLGEIGEIKRSDVVVMHIQIDGDTRGGFDLKWRGIALATFDGRRWFNPPEPMMVRFVQDGGFDLTKQREPWEHVAAPAPGIPYRFLRYRVMMEPIGTNVFFLATRPTALYGPYREVSTDSGGAVYNSDRDRMIGLYRAVSNIQEPGPEALRASAGEPPPRVALAYLQLPALDRRVRELAEKVTATAPTPYDKAAAIESYLTQNFGYSLVGPRTTPPDPLVYFLFDRKEGHCEYFASAMALMLRTLGIPARVVNGFRSGEFNPITGSYIIRARDAHSWVEAFFPGQGWVTFDPTPPDPKMEVTAWTQARLYLDAAREFWREWVINYDFAHQMSLSNTAMSRSRFFFDRVRMRVRAEYEKLLEAAKKTQERAVDRPQDVGAGGMAVVASVLLLLNLRRLWRMAWERALAANPEKRPRAAASIWYERMTRRVARRGWRKSPTQTPREFVGAIEDPVLRRRVQEFTERYERARFGESSEDAGALPELYEAIDRKD